MLIAVCGAVLVCVIVSLILVLCAMDSDTKALRAEYYATCSKLALAERDVVRLTEKSERLAKESLKWEAQYRTLADRIQDALVDP